MKSPSRSGKGASIAITTVRGTTTTVNQSGNPGIARRVTKEVVYTNVNDEVADVRQAEPQAGVNHLQQIDGTDVAIRYHEGDGPSRYIPEIGRTHLAEGTVRGGEATNQEAGTKTVVHLTLDRVLQPGDHCHQLGMQMWQHA